MSENRACGIVGYGLLGRALAVRLRDAGHDVAAFDVSAHRRQVMAGDGIAVRTDLHELTSAEVLIVAVYSADQARTVVGEVARWDAAATSVVVLVTTVTPRHARELAAVASGAGLDLVEFPVSGTSAQVATGDALGLVAGDPGPVGRVDAVLVAMTPRTVAFGPVGAASAAKLAINLVLEVNRSALAQGIAFAEMLGLDGRRFVDALALSAGASAVIGPKAPKMLSRDYEPEGRTSQSLKDMTMVRELAERAGQRLPLLNAQIELLESAVDVGDGDSDSSIVIELLRRSATVAA